MTTTHRDGPLRIGQIGAGQRGAAHRRMIAASPDHVALRAVCDLDAPTARNAAAEAALPADAVYTDAERMLREAAIDAVTICSSHASHAPLAKAAAAAGKHVLVEKPMADTLDGCREMIEAAERAGVTLMVSQNQRFNGSAVATKALIEHGFFGAVRGGEARWYQNIVRVKGSDPADNWLLDGAVAGGGVLMSLGVHQIDLLRLWLGEIETVYSVCRTFDPHFVNGAEDYCLATLTFERGAVVQMTNVYSSFAWPAERYPQQYLLSAERALMQEGRVCLTEPPPKEAGAFEDVIEAARTRGLPAVDDPNRCRMMRHFARCCAKGERPLCDGRDNLETMKAVEAVYASAERGTPVSLAELDREQEPAP